MSGRSMALVLARRCRAINYWDDVTHPGGCTILMRVDKARLISDFSTKGRCNGVSLAP